MDSIAYVTGDDSHAAGQIVPCEIVATQGYDLIAQVVAARLLDIDPFTPGGVSELESALGLEEGSAFIKPDSE